MATEVVSTIRASGGDYTSLSAWEAGEQKNLVTADEISVAECYNDWPSGLANQVDVLGWTTDATRYVRITVADGHWHEGNPTQGFYTTAGFGQNNFVLSTPYTRLERVRAINNGGTNYAIRVSAANCTVLRCSAKKATANGAVFYVAGYTGVKVILSHAYDSTLAGVVGLRSDFASGDPQWLNCISSNCTTGIYGGSSRGTYKNCLIYGCSTDVDGTVNASSTNNATSKSSAAIGSNATYNVASVDFVDAANNDFHLASGSVLIGAGTNLYSDFTTDIDGDTWPSSGAWDIGFDYRVAGGGSTDLTVAEASHGHSADSLTLSIGISLAIDDATHGHEADSLTLSTAGSTSLTVADATHAHTADAPALSVDSLLAVADALHAHSADNVVLGVSGAVDLLIADATHAHSVDGLVLTTDSLLAIQDALHAHAADALTLESTPTLLIADALHAHTSDGLALTVDAWLVIEDALHGHTADSITLGDSGAVVLVVADALHAHAADTLRLFYEVWAATKAPIGVRHASGARSARLSTTARPPRLSTRTR